MNQDEDIEKELEKYIGQLDYGEKIKILSIAQNLLLVQEETISAHGKVV